MTFSRKARSLCRRRSSCAADGESASAVPGVRLRPLPQPYMLLKVHRCKNGRMAEVRLQSRAEVAARIAELRPLTMADDSSDMNRLLDEVVEGTDKLLASTIALEDGRVVGWASAEQFRDQVVAGVFVHPDSRRQGIGSKLVELLLAELARVRPGVRPRTGPERFWGRFAVRPIKLSVYNRDMGKLTIRAAKAS